MSDHGYSSDTICAISTPPGEGGIGIVRLSGDRALPIVEALFQPFNRRPLSQLKSRSVHLGKIVDPRTGECLDEAMVTIMRAPRTYTREDVIELSCHGSPLVLQRVLEVVIQQGAVLAEPGEFTKRAFLNGRIDLVQAEAVMEVIRARTQGGLNAAIRQLAGKLSEPITRVRDELVRMLAHIEAGIDFVEEDITFHDPEECLTGIAAMIQTLQGLIDTAEEGRILREGLATAIIGRPNVGKSSLLNALSQTDRAIVTPIPGTTRDVLEEFINVRGIPVRFLDTAGVRSSHDVVEQEGVRRTYQALEHADFVLLVFDAGVELDEEDLSLLQRVRGKQHLLVLNKIDLGRRIDDGELQQLDTGAPIVAISATVGTGLEALKDSVQKAVMRNRGPAGEGVLVTQVRHKHALCRARDALELVRRSIRDGLSGEFPALDLRAAVDALGEIVGATTTDDILDKVFGEFCIGK